MIAPETIFSNGGRVGELMRGHDWSQSPLGAPSSWPPSLATVVALLLQSRFPMFAAWGDQLGFLYNDAYAEILGAKHPDALGRPFADIWAEIWPDISPLIHAAMAGEATYREDLPLLMQRKGYFEEAWFTFSYSPIRGECGRVAGMFCAVSETTQRVAAERALRESERCLREMNESLERRVADALAERRLLAEIVEATHAFVQVADLEYRWLAIKRAATDEFERIFGVRPAVGESMLDLLADQPEQQAAVKAVCDRALRGAEFTAIKEFGDPARDRRTYEMRFNAPRDRTGRQTGAYQFVYDVTERVRAEERLRSTEAALRQAQKMEALGQLTSGVAHDFNNLLAVFATALQLLERTGQPASPRMLDGMRRAVTRGTGLTRQLLAFSHRRPLHVESIDVVAHLAGLRAMLEATLGAQIEIDTRVRTATWPVHADPGEMELAVLNLCVNARDAMPGGGVITIAAENVTDPRDGGLAGDFVKISVSDTGIGMPPEVKARVFEPFFTTKEINKGTGLGLPRVYGFAQQSNGTVRVDSTVDVGTTVTLWLPRAPHLPDEGVPVDDAVAPVGRGGDRREQVLFVEDEPAVALLTCELFRSLDLVVVHVTSAEAALRLLTPRHEIDLVVSDVIMPGRLTGLQMARRIRHLHPGLPVLLTTGSSATVPGMAADEFPLLLKPYTVESLAAALAELRLGAPR